MAIRFNSSGANGLTALVPANSGFEGKLASTGNVCNDQVAPIGTKSFTATGPGTNYLMRQITGTTPRRVTWLWRIKATSAENMNYIEDLIRQYIADGRPYALEDNDGRATTKAVLLGPAEGTGVIGERRSVAGGGVLATWRLVFQVLVPATGAGEL